MERIAKMVLSVIFGLCAIFTLLFGLCWYFDGFSAAWGLFFGSDSLSAILSFIGIYDWLISAMLAIVMAGIIEMLIGRKIKAKAARAVVDIASGIVAFISTLMLISNV